MNLTKYLEIDNREMKFQNIAILGGVKLLLIKFSIYLM